MAENWIAVDHTTPAKPEIISLSMNLGISKRESVGLMVQVWIWADQNTYDGTTSCNGVSVTKALLDATFDVTGLGDALELVGWLTVDDADLIAFPHFGDHNGKTAKTRKQVNRRVAKHRNTSKNTTKAKTAKVCNAATVTKALPQEQEQEQEQFNLFYDAFNNKKAKAAAIKAFAKVIEGGTDPAMLIEKAGAFSAACTAAGSISPYPATWLNGRRWEDEGLPTAPAKPNAAGASAFDLKQRNRKQDVIYEKAKSGEWDFQNGVYVDLSNGDKIDPETLDVIK
jgi:hypothetical protein